MSPDRAAPLARHLALWRERERWGSMLRFAAGLLPLVGLLPLLVGAVTPPWRGRLALVWLLATGAAVVLRHGRRRRRIGEREIAAHLDRIFPDLEDSAALLAVGEAARSPLAALQRRRIARRLEELPLHAGVPWGPVRAGGRWLLAAAGATALLALAAAALRPAALRSPAAATGSARPAGSSGALAATVTLTVSPPAYTGLERRSVVGLGVEAPEGSQLEWRIDAAETVRGVRLLLDESRPLTTESRAPGVFTASLALTSSHLIGLRLDGDAGTVTLPLERLVAVRDRPPTLEIEAPAARTEMAPDGLAPVALRVRARDDYGVTTAEIVTTLASGGGESVRFRERRLRFDRATGPPDDRLLTAVLDPVALGLEAGSELYVVVEARDRRRPEPNVSRSASRVIRVSGGAGASVGLGAGLPVLRLPEFFRSQRQIILDTEKLLAERGGLTAAEVARRSEDLGLDQRALRMRYGGLLGEEFESGSPIGEDDEEATPPRDEVRAGGSIAELLEELPVGLAHQHDAAEINTFFDERVRAGMRAALAEMWGAEGELRRVAPETALPYEYRALDLLKRAQEATRVYVQKVGFEAPPLQPEERRLTGDLDAVRGVRRSARTAAEPELAALREAARVVAARLAAGAAEGPFDADELAALGGARDILVSRAVEQTSSDDLVAVDAIGRWLEGAAPTSRELEPVERALWGLLPPPVAVPERWAGDAGDLARRYRRLLEEER